MPAVLLICICAISILFVCTLYPIYLFFSATITQEQGEQQRIVYQLEPTSDHKGQPKSGVTCQNAREAGSYALR